MPRYFFHTADGTHQRDYDGSELPNVSSARKEAIRFAGALLNENPELLWDGHDFRVNVTDAAGKLVVAVIMLAVDASDEAMPSPSFKRTTA